MARELYRDCLAFYGDNSHPTVLAARGALGRCQWLAGDYGEAAGTLAEVQHGFANLPVDYLLDETHPWRLSQLTDYVIARRDADPAAADLRTLLVDALSAAPSLLAGARGGPSADRSRRPSC